MEKSQQTRERILDIAIEVFADTGLAASLRDVARRADVSPALVVHYFSNREGLFKEAISEATDFVMNKESGSKSDTDSHLELTYFLNAAHPKIKLLRRLLMSDTQEAEMFFSKAIQKAKEQLVASGISSQHDLEAIASLLAAQSMGTIIFFPHILDVLSESNSTFDTAQRILRASHFLYPQFTRNEVLT